MNKTCYQCNQEVYTLDFKEDKETDLFVCINCIPRAKVDESVEVYKEMQS